MPTSCLTIPTPPSPKGVTYQHQVVPGFSCPGDHRPECVGLDPNRQHGNHGDEWWYIVIGANAALSLRVFTPYRKGVAMRDDYKSRGANIALHTIFPVDLEQLRVDPGGCQYLGGRPCHDAWSSGIAAEAFFTEHGRDHGAASQGQQSQAFWAALTHVFNEYLVAAKAAHAALGHVRCVACDGAGIVSAASGDGGERP